MKITPALITRMAANIEAKLAADPTMIIELLDPAA